MNRVLAIFSDGLLSELDSARGLISRSAWIRQAVEEKLMEEATAPLVPEDAAFDELIEEAFAWPPVPEELKAKVLAAVDEAVKQQAEPKPKARRKDVRKVPDQPVSVKNRGGGFSTTQELSSKNVKGSPTASVGSLKVAQTASEKETAQVVSPESPSPKPRKPKGCPHPNTIRKIGMPFCEDCGEFV